MRASSRHRPLRAMAVPLCGLGALLAVSCTGQKPPPAAQDGDQVAAAVSDIVTQCRSVERGFVSHVDKAGLADSTDTLVDAAESFDLDATFSLREPAVEPETTLRDQLGFAARQLHQAECAPQLAAKLENAID